MNTQLSHAPTGLPVPARKKQPNPHTVIIALAVCMALQLTSYVMILPLFAQRFNDLGAGVEALGASSMAFALAATLAAPFMGALADRFGRRPLVLFSLAAYVAAFTGYQYITSVPLLIFLRGLAGAFTAGLMPSVYGIVADLAPVENRAKWIGIVNGGQSIGWIAGPVFGGLLFDHFGFADTLMVSIAFALVTFAVALVTVKEPIKHPRAVPEERSPFLPAFRSSLPKSIPTFLFLLGIYFMVMFAWAFIEPKFMFYAYDDLGWKASMLGMVMSFYGIAMSAGEFTLSSLSDRFGRKPVIIIGLALFSAQFLGLAFSRSYVVIAISFVIAGLGNAIFDPALSASILDMIPAGYQSRIMGIKSTAGSLGNILGPGLLVLFSTSFNAQSVFITAAGAVALTTLAALAALTVSKPPAAGLQPAQAEIKNP